MKFALNQVTETISHDYNSPYVRKVNKSIKQFKKESIQSTVDDIEYHEKKLKEESTRIHDRYNVYKNYLKFINENAFCFKQRIKINE